MDIFPSPQTRFSLFNKYRFSALIKAIALILLFTSVSKADDQVTIIVHYPDGNVVEYDKQTVYSTEMIDKIFTSKLKSWPNGLPIQAFTLPSSNPVHHKFVHKYLHTNIYQIQRIWNRLIFSGRGLAPMELRNENEMIEMVQQTAGSVGYISAQNITQLSSKKESK